MNVYSFQIRNIQYAYARDNEQIKDIGSIIRGFELCNIFVETKIMS